MSNLDEKLTPFGPTLRQQSILVGGILLGFGAFQVMTPPFSFWVTGGIAVLTLFLIWKAPVSVFNEAYINKKHFEFHSEDKFRKWLTQKRAEYTSMQNERKLKGFVDDPFFQKQIDLIDKYLIEGKK